MYEINVRNDHPALYFAADELKKYLRMMLPEGGDIPVGRGEGGFRVGLLDERSDDDTVFIETGETGGEILGSNPGAALIAVYRYLRLCGCRWLFPGEDGEWIPVLDALPPVSYRRTADHRYRGQCNEGAESQRAMLETIDFSPKLALNSYMLEFDVPFYYYDTYYSHALNSCRAPEPVSMRTVKQWKRQCETEIARRGLRFHDMGHGWTAEPLGLDSRQGWRAAESAELPEELRPFVAEINGRRELYGGVALNTNICFSNAEGRRRIAEYVAGYAQNHQNVSFLHIWLADANRNHCECALCREKRVSDWYVILLNEIDEALTARGLPTRIVFIEYYETNWAPLTERLKNPDRFTLLFAPLGRSYLEGYDVQADPSAMQPYDLNRAAPPRELKACFAHLAEWKKRFPGDAFAYEYHFWRSQYRDFSGLSHARAIYNDIRHLKSHGLSGVIEDGSQRSFFPTGFCYYVYGETLFDASVSFDSLVEDYFSHAFGADWKQVVQYLEGIGARMPVRYFSGCMSADPSRGMMYNPAVAETLRTVPEWVDAFRPVIQAHLGQEMRASDVSWRLLLAHADLVSGFALAAAKAADGEDASMDFRALRDEFSGREVYMERYYDHFLFWVSWYDMYPRVPVRQSTETPA